MRPPPAMKHTAVRLPRFRSGCTDPPHSAVGGQTPTIPRRGRSDARPPRAGATGESIPAMLPGECFPRSGASAKSLRRIPVNPATSRSLKRKPVRPSSIKIRAAPGLLVGHQHGSLRHRFVGHHAPAFVAVAGKDVNISLPHEFPHLRGPAAGRGRHTCRSNPSLCDSLSSLAFSGPVPTKSSLAKPGSWHTAATALKSTSTRFQSSIRPTHSSRAHSCRRGSGGCGATAAKYAQVHNRSSNAPIRCTSPHAYAPIAK